MKIMILFTNPKMLQRNPDLTSNMRNRNAN